MRATRASQGGQILQLLISARGAWVPLPKIAQHAAQYNSRLFELRRLGFNIENKTKTVDGVRHSWFRLVTGSNRKEPKYACDIQSMPAPTANLFSAIFRKIGATPNEASLNCRTHPLRLWSSAWPMPGWFGR